MSVRRVTGIGCAVAIGTLMGAGPVAAAPLDFAPGQKLEAECSYPLRSVTLTPLPGNGAFTPYQLSNGQLLVPTEFRVTSGANELLKARHLVPEGDDLVVAKGTTGPTKCSSTSSINGVTFEAVISGTVVGQARR